MRIIFALSLLLQFSCSEKKNDKTAEQPPKANASNNEAITKSGLQEFETLSFRRTYVGHENLSEKELSELHQSNPTLETSDSSSKIFKTLNRLRLLKANELVLSTCQDKKLSRDYLDEGRSIEITCMYDSLSMSKIDLLVKRGTKKDIKTLDFKGDHIIGIILKDIDDDNVKEVLVLVNYYIMNGDNYVLTILKYS